MLFSSISTFYTNVFTSYWSFFSYHWHPTFGRELWLWQIGPFAKFNDSKDKKFEISWIYINNWKRSNDLFNVWKHRNILRHKESSLKLCKTRCLYWFLDDNSPADFVNLFIYVALNRFEIKTTSVNRFSWVTHFLIPSSGDARVYFHFF